MNCLASEFMKRSVSNPEQQESYISQATELLNAAERLDMRDLSTMLNKGNSMESFMKIGILSFHMKDLDRALYIFGGALKISPSNLTANLGSATIFIMKKNYKQALANYQTILQNKPDMTPDVRVPIGICFAHLQMYDHAQKAFERAITRDPSNVQALQMLGILLLNRSRNAKEKNAELRRQGLIYLKMAYSMGAHNSNVLLVLADQFAEEGRQKEADQLLKHALSHSQGLKSDILFRMGKAVHKQGKYDEAFDLYQKALESNGDAIMTHYTLGQIYMQQGIF
jgi:RNA polymerase-associated protein CTR9